MEAPPAGVAASAFIGHALMLAAYTGSPGAPTLWQLLLSDAGPPRPAASGVTVIPPEQGMQAGLVITILLLLVVIGLLVRLELSRLACVTSRSSLLEPGDESDGRSA